jgi:hypothetical protein
MGIVPLEINIMPVKIIVTRNGKQIESMTVPAGNEQDNFVKAMARRYYEYYEGVVVSIECQKQ